MPGITPPLAGFRAEFENETVRKHCGKLGRDIETRCGQIHGPVTDVFEHNPPLEAFSHTADAPLEPTFTCSVPTQSMNRERIQQLVGEQDSIHTSWRQVLQ